MGKKNFDSWKDVWGKAWESYMQGKRSEKSLAETPLKVCWHEKFRMTVRGRRRGGGV